MSLELAQMNVSRLPARLESRSQVPRGNRVQDPEQTQPYAVLEGVCWSRTYGRPQR